MIECLQSLSFLGMTNRSKEISDAVSTTCKWISEDSKYLDWTTRTSGLLWIKGKPGAGKSTLMKDIVKAVEVSRDKSWSIASFFFHGRGEGMQKNVLGLFQSLLYQLAQQMPGLLEEITREYVTNRKMYGKFEVNWVWHITDLQIVFRRCVAGLAKASPVRIFVDALDECGEDSATAIVSFFKTVAGSLSICFSCRHYPIIALGGDGLEICVEDNNSQDIQAYIDCQFSDLVQHGDDARFDTIRSQILHKASGTFQWVKLVTNIAIQLERRGKDPKTIQSRIEFLPRELDDLYHELLSTLDEYDKPRTLLLMQWIYYAMRPLTLQELRIAMAIDSNIVYKQLQHCCESENYAKTKRTFRANVLDLSRGLVEFVEHDKKQVAQFVHQSVKDYLRERGLQLLQDDGSWAPAGSIAGRSHFRLSRSCIRYFHMEEIQGFDFVTFVRSLKIPKHGRVIHALYEKFPLLDYTACNWLLHCQKSEDEQVSQEDLISIYQTNAPLPLNETQICERNGHVWQFPCPKLVSISHIASAYNLVSVIRAMVLQGLDVDSQDDEDTPLILAANYGHEAIVRLLLRQKSVNVNAYGALRRTSLHCAAGPLRDTQARRMGCENVVKLLLMDQACLDRNPRDQTGRTPLSVAAEGGCETAVRALLMDQACIDRNPKEETGRTPLSLAAEWGRSGVVEILLNDNLVEKNSRDDTGRTPLSWAAERGSQSVVELLLKCKDVDAGSKDDTGRSIFFYACRFGGEATARLLAESKDVDVSFALRLEDPLTKEILSTRPRERPPVRNHRKAIGTRDRLVRV